MSEDGPGDVDAHVARVAEQAVKAYLRALAPVRGTVHNAREHLLPALHREAERLLGLPRVPASVADEAEELLREFIARSFALASHTANAQRALRPLALAFFREVAQLAAPDALRRGMRSPLRLAEVVLDAYCEAADIAVTHRVNAAIYLDPLLRRLCGQLLRAHHGPARDWAGAQDRVDAHVVRTVEEYADRCQLWLTHGQNVERFLRPLVEDLVGWAQGLGDELDRAQEGALAAEGRSEDPTARTVAQLVSRIDPALRGVLRDQEYVSAEHVGRLLGRLEGAMRALPLPPPSADGDEEQARKDLAREMVSVGGRRVDGAQVPERVAALVGDDRPDVVRAVVLAASRTVSGGDSFFVVNDLFGDPSVLVTPADVRAAAPISVELSGDAAADGAAPAVEVRTTNCYALFHRDEVEGCLSSDEARPLLTLETVMLSEIPLSGGESEGRVLSIARVSS